MPKAFNTLTAIAAPIMRANIDTDVIIRIDRLVGNSTFAARSANGPSVRCAICLTVRRTPNSF